MSADEQREPASAPDNESRATLNDDLRHEDVEVVFRELLGRSATPDDVDSWMPVGSLRVFLDGVLASEEYAGRMARLKAIEEAPAARGSFLNCWVDGWERYARPSGDVSTDGVVIVGESGHLFLAGGSNDNAASHLGDVEVAAGWLEEWRKLMAERLSQARQADRRVAHLIVPDKLAVYADYFPRDLTPRGPRPALRLLDEGRLPLVYPLDALRDARSGGDTYLHADSHLTNRGYRILAEAALRELGVSPRFLPAEENVTAPYLAQGDLGSHFDPPVLELRRRMAVSTKTVVVSDNREDISRVGGHIGMIVVLRNESAPAFAATGI